MKHFLLTCLSLATTLLPAYGATYQEALATYLQISGDFSAEQSARSLLPLVTQVFDGDEEQASQALSAYTAEQQMNDVTEVLMPFYQKHITEQELQHLSSIYSTPGFAELMKRAVNETEALPRSSEYKKLVQLEDISKQVVKGRELKNVKMPKNVSEEYISLFQRYYTASGAVDVFNKRVEFINNSIRHNLRNAGSKAVEEDSRIVKDYLKANLSTLLLSKFHSLFTKDELRIITEASEGNIQTNAAAKEYREQGAQIGALLIYKAAEWLSVRYPDRTEAIKPILVESEALGNPTKGEIHRAVEQQPQFSGGKKEMYNYIYNKIVYPQQLKLHGFHGKGIYQIVVNRDGQIADFSVLQSSGNENLDTQAGKVFVSMPKWTPGRLGGEIVRTQLVVPVEFHLDSMPEQEDDGVVFIVVEQMPEFPGGQQALFKYLNENVKYPAIAKENGIQGRVICQFVVNTDGSISNVEVVKSGGDPSLDKEAVRVLKGMPRWRPGIQRGVRVRVKFTVPVNFSLTNNKNKK